MLDGIGAIAAERGDSANVTFLGECAVAESGD
jgi:hypothetical protein